MVMQQQMVLLFPQWKHACFRNCVKHYCIQKGKSSLVGNREVTFKSQVWGTWHFSVQGSLRMPPHHWLCCYWPLVLGELQHSPQGSHKCPHNVLLQRHTSSRRWITKDHHTAHGNKQLQLQPAPHLHLLQVPVQGFPSHAMGTPDQPYPHPWPSTSLTDLLLGPKIPILETPAYNKLFCSFFLICCLQRVLERAQLSSTPPPLVLIKILI